MYICIFSVYGFRSLHWFYASDLLYFVSNESPRDPVKVHYEQVNLLTKMDLFWLFPDGVISCGHTHVDTGLPGLENLEI